MNGNLNEKIRESLYQADFDKISNYIVEICELIVDDYLQKQLVLPNDENQIRSIMLEEYLKKYKKAYGMCGYRFDLEVPEHYIGKGKHAGRVDIRIVLKNDFEKDDACYIIECKRIDGSLQLNKKYIKDGVARFITQKYSAYYGRNIMLAFVVKKINLAEAISQIDEIQNLESDEQMHSKFEPLGKTVVTESYRCIHNTPKGALELRHIFSDYSSIM